MLVDLASATTEFEIGGRIISRGVLLDENCADRKANEEAYVQ